MQPDLEKYRPYVDRYDLTEEQKVELIHTVWTIMESFVDSAFGTHPVQLCQKPLPMDDSNGSESRVPWEKPILTDQFKKCTGSCGRKGDKDHDEI